MQVIVAVEVESDRTVFERRICSAFVKWKSRVYMNAH
jgi:hypothetical protein